VKADNSMTHIADYHETEEGMPLVYDLGRLCLEWNTVEQFFTALIWTYFGDHGVGMAVTGGLGGNKSKAEVLLNLARQSPQESALIDRIEFACEAFNVLRENRNVLVHSHTIFRIEGGKPQWRRATGRGPTGHLSTEANLEDLENLIADICKLGLFVIELVPFLRKEKRGGAKCTLPDKFPLPKKLKQLPAELERDK
jgi:hypothetical protein